jgi:hypothetical protein
MSELAEMLHGASVVSRMPVGIESRGGQAFGVMQGADLLHMASRLGGLPNEQQIAMGRLALEVVGSEKHPVVAAIGTEIARGGLSNEGYAASIATKKGPSGHGLA